MNNQQGDFIHYNDFAKVITKGEIYHFGKMQSQVIKQLYEVANSNSPWLFGKELLYKAGATTMRLSDLFKSQPKWRNLIESDRRGNYRLKLSSTYPGINQH
ncbi:MAG: hypothetical protein HRU35_00995 [Rickettsiaceae bacterium]|nr:hypothetical protein [Rickettsiaceae bacterium]